MRAKEIRELVKIVEESHISELEVSRWGRKIRISKNIMPGLQNAEVSIPSKTTTSVHVFKDKHPVEQTTDSQRPVQPENEGSRLIEIKSPMVGTFYRSPAPDADAYVQEGDQIRKGSILCIIEAMKLMNEIEAEISGTIVKVLVENAQPVEYDQALFLVEPA